MLNTEEQSKAKKSVWEQNSINRPGKIELTQSETEELGAFSDIYGSLRIAKKQNSDRLNRHCQKRQHKT